MSQLIVPKHNYQIEISETVLPILHLELRKQKLSLRWLNGLNYTRETERVTFNSHGVTSLQLCCLLLSLLSLAHEHLSLSGGYFSFQSRLRLS